MVEIPDGELNPDALPIVSLTWQKITEAATAETLNGYMMAGTFTLTLPATPSVGAQVGWKVISGQPTLGRNGQKIEGEEQDLVLNIVDAGGVFVFAGGNEGWVNVTEIGAGGNGNGGMSANKLTAKLLYGGI